MAPTSAAIRGLETRLDDISEPARRVGSAVRRHRSGADPQPRGAGRRAFRAPRPAERAAAGIRGHRAAPRRHRALDRRQPRNACWKPRARPRKTPSARWPDRRPNAAVSGLAEDLKALEALTRRSDERNTKTFEAIHDTLLKIVDRLGSLEQEATGAAPEASARARSAARWRCRTRPRSISTASLPQADATRTTSWRRAPRCTAKRRAHRRRRPRPRPPLAGARNADAGRQRTPADAPRPLDVRRPQPRAFSGKKQAETAECSPESQPAVVAHRTAPIVDLDAPLDPKFANRPLEPGSGAPDLNAIMQRVRDERGQPAQAERDRRRQGRLHRRRAPRRAGRRRRSRSAASAGSDIDRPGAGVADRRSPEGAAQADPDGSGRDHDGAGRPAARQGVHGRRRAGRGPKRRVRRRRRAAGARPPRSTRCADARRGQRATDVTQSPAPTTCRQPKLRHDAPTAAPATTCSSSPSRRRTSTEPAQANAADDRAKRPPSPNTDVAPMADASDGDVRSAPASAQAAASAHRRAGRGRPGGAARSRRAPATPRRCSRSARAMPKAAASTPT